MFYLQIYDPVTPRYEVPFPVNLPTESAASPLADVAVGQEGEDVELSVVRTSNGANLWVHTQWYKSPSLSFTWAIKLNSFRNQKFEFSSIENTDASVEHRSLSILLWLLFIVFSTNFFHIQIWLHLIKTITK